VRTENEVSVVPVGCWLVERSEGRQQRSMSTDGSANRWEEIMFPISKLVALLSLYMIHVTSKVGEPNENDQHKAYNYWAMICTKRPWYIKGGS
jgi:hypothetical protein